MANDHSLPPIPDEWDRGAREHYTDPAYYDRTYDDRRLDVEYYVRLARRTAGNVLEYGVGTGRIALPMVQAGRHVTGVDLSEIMLAELREKHGKSPKAHRDRLTLHAGDMRTWRTTERFSLIIAGFNTILHLYRTEDLEAFLARVREHLAPGGVFAFDFTIPQGEDLGRDPERWYGAPRFRHPTTGQLCRYAERFEYDPLHQLLTVWMRFTPDAGDPWVTLLTHRQWFPQEVLGILRHAGFEVVASHSDFSSEEPHPDTDFLALQCRVKD